MARPSTDTAAKAVMTTIDSESACTLALASAIEVTDQGIPPATSHGRIRPASV